MKILDHGFVRLIRVGGTEEEIEAAARQSYGAVNRTIEERTRLLRYLMKNRHTTPFEMVDMVFQVKCPIFVARQWLRHRTASINELSGRYSEMPHEYYVPDVSRIKGQGVANKQGSEGGLGHSDKTLAEFTIRELSEKAFEGYKHMLNLGVSREIARIVLPLNTYTTFTWKMNLHNLLHFLKLRLDPHAQWEIRVYAEAIAGMVKDSSAFPITWAAFLDYVLNEGAAK